MGPTEHESGDPWTDAGPDMGDLFDELEALRATVDDPDEREQVEETMEVAAEVTRPGRIRRVIWGFDRGDVAEATLGSLVFGVPMFVEGGTLEVGTFLAARPLLLLATVAASVAVVVGILYVADFRDVRVRDRILGVVPRRLVGVLGVALILAIFAMTAWGRVDWADPWLAFSQSVVAFGPMAIGAALGDIIPGT